MGVQWSEESGYLREMRRWDRPKNQYVETENGKRIYGMNRTGHEEFPKMLYMAQKHPISGRYEVAGGEDVLSLDRTRVMFDAEEFSKRCQMIVNDETELGRAKAAGWRETQAEAMALHNTNIDELAAEALKRARAEQSMSPQAQAEAAAYEATTPEHVAEIPEKRKRGRPRKVQPPAA